MATNANRQFRIASLLAAADRLNAPTGAHGEAAVLICRLRDLRGRRPADAADADAAVTGTAERMGSGTACETRRWLSRRDRMFWDSAMRKLMAEGRVAYAPEAGAYTLSTGEIA